MQAHKAKTTALDLQKQPPSIVNIQPLWSMDPAVAHARNPDHLIEVGSGVTLARALPFTGFSEEPASWPQELPGSQQPARATILTVSPPDLVSIGHRLRPQSFGRAGMGPTRGSVVLLSPSGRAKEDSGLPSAP